MSASAHTYYLSQSEPTKSCLLALRSIILAHDTSITETQKYGMPCFCHNRKVFCYLWTDKKSGEPYILFVEGNKLDHPGLERGSRSRMKILRVDATKDLPLHKIETVLKSALELYQSGMIKIKP